MAWVVPDDIAAAKQQNLAGQLIKSETGLSELRAVSAIDPQDLDQLLALMEQPGRVYQSAEQSLRRSLNQAWFLHFVVSENDQGLNVSGVER